MDDNRILAIDKMKNLKDFVPLFVGVSYLFGFVIVNSFLSKYRIYATSIFESEYLVAGTIFTLLFGILFLSIYFTNKHVDVLSDNLFDFYLPALLRVLLLSYSYCFLIIDTSVVSAKNVMIFNYLGLFIWFFFFLINQVKLHSVTKWILFFLISISSNVFIFIVCKECRFLLLIVIGYGILGILSISDIIKKQYQKAQALGSILVFISLAMLFGFGVYDNIAKRFGGGKPEKISLLVDSQKIGVLPSSIKLTAGNVIDAQLIYSSDKEYSLKQDSKLITLNKDIFVGYINKK